MDVNIDIMCPNPKNVHVTASLSKNGGNDTPQDYSKK